MNYIVLFGYMNEHREECPDFDTAIRALKAHREDWEAERIDGEYPSMLGCNHEDDCDGLTEDERERISNEAWV